MKNFKKLLLIAALLFSTPALASYQPPCGATGEIQFNDDGLCGAYNSDEATAYLNVFSATLQGMVPASGGGTTNFLNASGAWTVPTAAGTAGGSLAGAYPSPTIANSGVTAGSYSNMSATVGADGRVTAASNGAAPVTSVSGTANRITSTNGATPVIDISSSYIGQSSITTVGTLSSGAVPASLVTAGTFGTGNYIFNGNVSATNLSGTNTGDITLSGENYITLSSQAITAHAVDLSGSNVTGNLGVSHLNSGTSATADSVWSGDASWSNISTATLAISAAGTNNSTATALSSVRFNSGVYEVTTTGSGQGVKLPTAVKYSRYTIVNRGANALIVYPTSTNFINAQSSGVGYTLGVNESMLFYGVDVTHWYTAIAFSGGDANTSDGSGILNFDLTKSHTWTGVQTFSNGAIGALTGNASTATALQTAMAIGGVNFDGTAPITPQQIQPAAENSDTTNFPLFVNAASGTAQQPKYNSGFGYNASTNVLSTAGLNLSGLTASKVAFTDSSKNLTSTGIGTSAQFIKGDGSLDSATYGLGSVTSITFTGDGALLSNTPSSAVTTSGTVAATLANAGAKTIWGNATGSTAAPSYTTAPIVSGLSTALNFNATATGTTSSYQAGGTNTYWRDDTNHNLSIGNNALQTTVSQSGGGTNGQFNLAIGQLALNAVTTGNINTGIGYQAGVNITTGAQNFALGYSSLDAVSTGSKNVGVGDSTLSSGTAGSNNTAIGEGALLTSLFTAGSNNTVIGQGALSLQISSAGGNTVIGAQVGAGSSSSATKNILIGFDNTVQSAGANYLNIGNAIQGTGLGTTPNIGIGSVSSPSARLQLPAGSATASTAPLKFTSGTSLTTPENGAMEYDGTDYFVTAQSTRQKVIKGLSGSFSTTGAATATFTVTFGGTQPNSTYRVLVTPTDALAAAIFYVNNKTATSFDVVYLAGLTGTVSFDYELIQ